ncbi:NAD-binding protein [Nonomuraea sp. NBC_00507]|uniref:NAD-binding protein n=1 Tax=Nonomuraea sp. NBC_00507 TaxID=2976002 RepID=UPI002E1722D1
MSSIPTWRCTSLPLDCPSLRTGQVAPRTSTRWLDRSAEHPWHSASTSVPIPTPCFRPIGPAARPLPGRLTIVGGGYQGIEFASIDRRFGSQVTVVEAAPIILGREDGRAA